MAWLKDTLWLLTLLVDKDRRNHQSKYHSTKCQPVCIHDGFLPCIIQLTIVSRDGNAQRYPSGSTSLYQAMSGGNYVGLAIARYAFSKPIQ